MLYPAKFPTPPKSQAPPRYNTTEGSALLRTFNKDIQLLPPTYYQYTVYASDTPPPVVYRDLVKENGGLPVHLRFFHQMDRLNILACIPDLNLVVITSQIGRAALMSLTRLPDSSHGEPVSLSLAARDPPGPPADVQCRSP
jgi:hypothetical protein